MAFYARGKLTGELWGGANLRETETNPPTQSSHELGAAAQRQTAHDILLMVSLGEPGNWAWGQGTQGRRPVSSHPLESHLTRLHSLVGTSCMPREALSLTRAEADRFRHSQQRSVLSVRGKKGPSRLGSGILG